MKFTDILDEEKEQKKVFDLTKNSIKDFFNGKNSSIFAQLV